MASLAIPSCQKDSEARLSSAQEHAQLQKILDSDPDVIHARKLFFEHTQILLSFTPKERETFIEKIKSCNSPIYQTSIKDLRELFSETSGSESFVSCIEKMKQYLGLVEVIKQKYPAFAKLTTPERSALLSKINLPETKALLESSKIKK